MQISEQGVSDAEVDAALAQQGNAPAGERLISELLGKLQSKDPQQPALSHVPSLTRLPTLSYRNVDTNEIFTPSIGIHDLQQARLAAAHPRFQQFVALTEKADA